MAYKLQKFEDEICTRIKRIYKNAHELAEMTDYYERNTDYADLEKAIIWFTWRLIGRMDGYALYDKMREKVPDFNDRHVETLFRNAIHKNYNYSITELLQIYRNTNYHAVYSQNDHKG